MPMKPSRIFLSSSFPVAVPALFGAAESGACSSSDAGGEPRSSTTPGRAHQGHVYTGTERMIKGECRLIPVLRGKVVPPPALKGLIYADFRRSFSRGFDAVIAALQREGDDLVLSGWENEIESIAWYRNFRATGPRKDFPL
jgi:hypothetical protein